MIVTVPHFTIFMAHMWCVCICKRFFVTFYGAKRAYRARYHVACALWAVGPCRTPSSCWTLLWMGRKRTLDTEVTRERKVLSSEVIWCVMWTNNRGARLN